MNHNFGTKMPSGGSRPQHQGETCRVSDMASAVGGTADLGVVVPEWCRFPAHSLVTFFKFVLFSRLGSPELVLDFLETLIDLVDIEVAGIKFVAVYIDIVFVLLV